MLPRHLNQIELSRRWGLSPRTLERWRRLGQGPRFLKIGGRVLYRLEDVEAVEAARLQGGGPPAACISSSTASAPSTSSTTAHHNAHLAMSLKERSFAGRDPIPWGISDGYGPAG